MRKIKMILVSSIAFLFGTIGKVFGSEGSGIYPFHGKAVWSHRFGGIKEGCRRPHWKVWPTIYNICLVYRRCHCRRGGIVVVSQGFQGWPIVVVGQGWPVAGCRFDTYWKQWLIERSLFCGACYMRVEHRPGPFAESVCQAFSDECHGVSVF